MTIAKLIVILAICLTVIAVALIVAAVIIREQDTRREEAERMADYLEAVKEKNDK